MKRIISFSLWGSNAGYCVGAVDNVKRARTVYPGWVCRFYVDPIVPRRYVDQLLAEGAEVIHKPKSEDFSGLYWRFEPMYDDGAVERFIVRDTDSRVNVREADAVAEWITSDKPFHVMRDNPSHTVAIMGGMWGARAGTIPEFKLLMDDWVTSLPGDSSNPRGRFHGTDQTFLEKHIWPYMVACHLAHIGHEKTRRTAYDRPFRVKLNRDGYVGMIYSADDEDRTQPIQVVAGDAATEVSAA